MHIRKIVQFQKGNAMLFLLLRWNSLYTDIFILIGIVVVLVIAFIKSNSNLKKEIEERKKRELQNKRNSQDDWYK